MTVFCYYINLTESLFISDLFEGGGGLISGGLI